MVILEFNEEQQLFRDNGVVNGIPENQENQIGWKTLMYCKNHKESDLFLDFLQLQFIEKRVAKFDELKKTIDNLIKFINTIKKK